MTILLRDPDSTPEVVEMTFMNEAEFDRYLNRTSTCRLLKDGKSPAIMRFDQLEQGAEYTTGVRGVPARAWRTSPCQEPGAVQS